MLKKLPSADVLPANSERKGGAATLSLCPVPVACLSLSFRSLSLPDLSDLPVFFPGHRHLWPATAFL
jgi:hypothetical protein